LTVRTKNKLFSDPAFSQVAFHLTGALYRLFFQPDFPGREKKRIFRLTVSQAYYFLL